MTAQELKNSILQLAVQGKLVPQYKDDEPASELLKRIRAEKEKLGRKDKPLPAITEDEIPFDIPENWEWARLNDISSITSGGTPARTNSSFWNGDIPWVKIGDIRNKYISTTEEEISEQGLNSSSAKIFPKGTILYTIFATIGTVGILNIDAATNQAIAGVTFFGEYNRDYMYYVLIGLKDILVSKGKGMAQMNINLTILKNTPIPIPPLAEQKRIVEKIEELMPLIEEYGKAEEQLSKLNAEFPDKLRKSILQQAVQGKLTERDPADEPASELLKRINSEKEALIKAGKIKKEKPLPSFSNDEMPFDIPETWEWVQLGMVVSIRGGKRMPKGRELITSPTEHIYVRVTDMQNGTILADDLHYVPNDVYPKIKDYIIKKDDVYLVIVGSTIGKTGLVPDMFDGMNLTENAVRLIPILIDKKYLFTMLSTEFVLSQMMSRVKQEGQPKLAIERLRTTIIPLPPLSEQKRIVKRVEELLALCDELKY